MKEYSLNIAAGMAHRMISVVYEISYLEWFRGPISIIHFPCRHGFLSGFI